MPGCDTTRRELGTSAPVSSASYFLGPWQANVGFECLQSAEREAELVSFTVVSRDHRQ